MPQPQPLQAHWVVFEQPAGWQGENSDWPPDIIPRDMLSATWNIYHIGPEILSRPGMTREIFISAGATVVAGFTANFDSGQKYIYQTDNGRFWQASAGLTSAVAMGTSAFGTPACFTQLANIVAITTNGGQMLGASGSDGVFALGDATTPKARFIMAYKNRLFADGGSVSADTVFWSAIGATTGLPTPMDWTTAGNAGTRIFNQGEGGPIIGLSPGRDQWYAFKTKRTYVVTGGTPASFVTVDGDREWGAYHRSIALVGRGLIGANEDGIASVIDGKVEPLTWNRITQFWTHALSGTNVSAFTGAWIASRNQYRLTVQLSSGNWMMLTGVLEPGRPIAWYRWGVSSQAVWPRWPIPGTGGGDFYCSLLSSGYAFHMDQGTADATSAIIASAQTGIVGHYIPHSGGLTFVPDQAYFDKRWHRAWTFARTQPSAATLSSMFFIHSETGEWTPTSNFTVGLNTSAGGIKRQTHNLEGRQGWGVSWRIIFDTLSGGGVHKGIVEYAESRIGTQSPNQ